MNMNQFQQLIKEICEEENIKFHLLSKNWIIMLEKNQKTKFIAGYKFDLNSHGFGNVLDDKYATYEIFSQKQLPIIKHHIMFSPQNKEDYAVCSNQYQFAFELFETYNQNIVIKPNEGTSGRDVYHITKKEELIPCLEKLFQSNFSVSICPFYNIKMEYRMIIFQNECQIIYGKKRATVIGDGKQTIRELLIKLNPCLKPKLMDSQYDKILEKREEYSYNWKNNLSEGSIPIPVDEKIRSKLEAIQKQMIQKISLEFCSVDIIETEKEFLILELNSGVMMNHYMELFPNGKKIAKEIYRKALQTMFDN